MSKSIRLFLALLCWIISFPLGIAAYKGFMLALPYLGMFIFAMIIGSILVYYFEL